MVSHVIFCEGRLLKYAIAEEGVEEWKGGEDSRKKEEERSSNAAMI